LIFVAAIKANACGIILSHSHPSGNRNPSQADIDLTKEDERSREIS
jgi:DNA repair protein RadC